MAAKISCKYECKIFKTGFAAVISYIGTEV